MTNRCVLVVKINQFANVDCILVMAWGDHMSLEKGISHMCILFLF